MDADRDLQRPWTGAGGKKPDRVSRRIRRDDELRLVADKDTGDAGQTRNRKQILLGCRVEDIDRIVRRVCDVDMAARRVDCRVIERSLSFVLRQGDMSHGQQWNVGHDAGLGFVLNRKAIAMMAPAVINPTAVTAPRAARPAVIAGM